MEFQFFSLVIASPALWPSLRALIWERWLMGLGKVTYHVWGPQLQADERKLRLTRREAASVRQGLSGIVWVTPGNSQATAAEKICTHSCYTESSTPPSLSHPPTPFRLFPVPPDLPPPIYAWLYTCTFRRIGKGFSAVLYKECEKRNGMGRDASKGFCKLTYVDLCLRYAIRG